MARMKIIKTSAEFSKIQPQRITDIKNLTEHGRILGRYTAVSTKLSAH
jgi:hypothetical protein